MNDLTDIELVELVKGGSAAAFDEIFRRYLPIAKIIAFQFLKSSCDAEEIAAQAMMSVHRSIPDFKGDCSLKTWINTIVRNLAFNRHAYLKRRMRWYHDSIDAAAPEGFALHERLKDGRASPVQEEEHRELESRIDQARDRLGPKHRHIMALLIEQGKTYEDIAAIVGIKIGTVKSRVARAREELRRNMGCVFA